MPDYEPKLVCYYSNWAVYRPGLAKFTPENINPYLCTHIIYAFASLSEDFKLQPFDPYNDVEQGENLFNASVYMYWNNDKAEGIISFLMNVLPHSNTKTK